MHHNQTTPPKTILVGLQLPNVSLEDHNASLSELGRLVTTLGFEVVGTLSQKRSIAENSTILGEGKLQELCRRTGGSGKIESMAQAPRRKNKVVEAAPEVEESDDEDAEPKADTVVFDDELSPTQLRNLEMATGAQVMDRTGVIIEIFHRHARTREARIQVDIARLRYLSPRLRMNRVGQDRQGGGIGAKGIGETAHELDKRRIRDRIAELKDELEDIHKNQQGRRQRRRDQAKVALVGYTNAGKSSLMRALTGSDVLVEDKLFATLDTTIRAMQPETLPRILVSDTVGFIKKLPHDLVASFRSTLDEAADASLLIFVVDAADPTFRSQLETTRRVLTELKLDLDATPSLLILNKIDCVDEPTRNALQDEFPDAVAMSARSKEDVAKLRNVLIAHFEKDMIEAEIVIAYDRNDLRAEVHRNAKVLSEDFAEDGVHMRIRALSSMVDSFKSVRF